MSSYAPPRSLFWRPTSSATAVDGYGRGRDAASASVRSGRAELLPCGRNASRWIAPKDVSHMTVACQGREKADCRDHRCSHHVEISADRWPDDVRLSDIEPGFVCTACGWVNSECGSLQCQLRSETDRLVRRHELSPSADRRHGSISSPPNNQPYERDARSCSITEQLNSDTQTVAARALARHSLERSQPKAKQGEDKNTTAADSGCG